MKKIRSVIVMVLSVAAFFIILTNTTGEETRRMYSKFAAEMEREEIFMSENQDFNSRVEVKVLDVGQGLSVLIKSGEEYALYDGGGRDSSRRVVATLKNEGIERFKYVFASHYDEDHISGLVGVLKNFDVSKVIGPDYVADSKIYKSFENAAGEISHPNRLDRYTVGSVTLTVLSLPKKYFGENDNSIVLKLECDSFSMLLTGDAGYDAEYDILRANADVASDVLLVGHHGSDSSTSSSWLKNVSPAYAIISVGENDYGHPDNSVINAIEKSGAAIYRTDEIGSVTIVYDGEQIICY